MKTIYRSQEQNNNGVTIMRSYEHDEENKEVTIEIEARNYTSIGSYPIFYIGKSTHEIFCPCCALEADQEMIGEINYEIEHLYCDDCQKLIEAAYIDSEE